MQVRSCTHRNRPYFCAAAPINRASVWPLQAFRATPEVAQFARQLQALEIDQRLVDHHRLDLGRLVHPVLEVGLQVAVRRLFDVLRTLERCAVTAHRT